MEWYEYNEEDRIKNVYSKYTIQNFFEWWQNGTNNIMEIRITNFELIKKLANELQLPYSKSGLYISNVAELKTLIKHIRENNVTAWFGVNSRKKAYNKWNKKGFGGRDVNINNIEFLFIDIDRRNKISTATNEELKKCDILSNKILEKMGENGWNKNYIKICSGNGIQLLFRLDVSIKLPQIEYDMNKKMYNYSDEMEQLKSLIREGIGKDILKFCNKYGEELNVEVDKSVFNIGRVASLPYTKNYKYGGYTWRGIIETKGGINVGLSDYILLKLKNIKQWKVKTVFINHSRKTQNMINSMELKDHPLVKFMLDVNLPHGQINNLLWMQVKCLIRDNNLNFSDKNVQTIHNLLEDKYNDKFTTNLPDKKYEFKEEIINRYCGNNLFPPLFPLEKIRLIKEAFNFTLNWDMIKFYNSEIELVGGDMFEDMNNFKQQLIQSGEKIVTDKIYIFTNSCIKKYGVDKTRYFFTYWFDRWIGYRNT